MGSWEAGVGEADLGLLGLRVRLLLARFLAAARSPYAAYARVPSSLGAV